MTVLVVGSVALDSVETPFGKADNVLGGSAAGSGSDPNVTPRAQVPEAARLLHVDYKTLHVKMKQYRLDASSFRPRTRASRVSATSRYRFW